MSKIPCELVQDLLPNYIEKLTGEKSTELIQAHLQSCEDCRKVYQSMLPKEQEDEAAKNSGEKTEIDFLKKNRRRNRMIVLACVLGGLVLAAGLLYSWFFLIGEKYAEGIYCKVKVEGLHVTAAGGFADSIHVVRKIRFSEQDGVITLTPRSVLASAFHRGEFKAEYDAKEEVREVRMNGKSLWHRGGTDQISANLSDEILRTYEEWDKKTELEQALSSTGPGWCTKCFKSWADLVNFLGCEPENPFEYAQGFEKMNAAGENIPDAMSGRLEHVQLTFVGNRDGQVVYYEVQAGYQAEGVAVVYTVKPLGWSFAYTGVEFIVQNTAMMFEQEAVVMPQGDEVFTRNDERNNIPAEDIFYLKNGVPCWVRLVSRGDDISGRADALFRAEEIVRELVP